MRLKMIGLRRLSRISLCSRITDENSQRMQRLEGPIEMEIGAMWKMRGELKVMKGHLLVMNMRLLSVKLTRQVMIKEEGGEMARLMEMDYRGPSSSVQALISIPTLEVASLLPQTRVLFRVQMGLKFL